MRRVGCAGFLAFVACTSNDGVTLLDAPPPEPGPPVVLLLHGSGASGAAVNARWQVPDAIAPDARLGPGGLQTWNASVAFGTGDGRDDVAELVAIAEQHLVAGERAIVMGEGNGGSMAWRLVCARPDVFSVAVILGGTANADGDPPCTGGLVVSTLHVHGTVDSIVQYGGGQLAGQPVAYPSVAESIRQEQGLAGCSPKFLPDVPELGAPVEAIGCGMKTVGFREVGAEHWRVIGWDHNPVLPDGWGDLVLTWASTRR